MDHIARLTPIRFTFHTPPIKGVLRRPPRWRRALRKLQKLDLHKIELLLRIGRALIELVQDLFRVLWRIEERR